jgi:hypothetical protein
MKKDAMVKTQFPAINILPWPHISANLPKGTRNMPAARVNASAIQLNNIASMARSLPMDGRATFTAERATGIRKDPMVVTISTGLPPLVLSGFFIICRLSRC